LANRFKAELRFLFRRNNSGLEKYKDETRFSNGFSYGLTIEKTGMKSGVLRTGFEISNQNENMIF
jgi:hypothetical protein